MPKVSVLKSVSKDSFPVMAATVTSGWLPGTFFTLNSLGYAVQATATGDDAMFIAGDDDTEVVSPPSGSLLTQYYGSGTRLEISHAAEKAAGTVTAAYLAYSKTEVEAATRGASLYCDTSGKWCTSASGSIKGKLVQVPSSANDYTLGVILRF
jgi:hypothetical protein